MQGSSVADTFLQLPGWKVRGITRNPSSEASQALASKGVELVKADLDEKESLIPAFEGASVIFSNTDFFVHLFSAGELPAGRTANEYARDREAAQGINTAEAACSPVVLKTLERFVLSSLSDARKWNGGKYTNVYHYDAKIDMIRAIHERFPEVAARMSLLQMGHYVTNWKAVPAMMPQKQPDGSFLVTRPVGPNVQFPFVDTDRDTGAFVKALVDTPAGIELLGVSESMTWPEWTKLWGDVHGVRTEYKQVSTKEFYAGLPEPLRVELEDSFDYVNEFGYTGGDPDVVTPQQVSFAKLCVGYVTHSPQLSFQIPLTSVEEYFKSEDWSPVFSS